MRSGARPCGRAKVDEGDKTDEIHDDFYWGCIPVAPDDDEPEGEKEGAIRQPPYGLTTTYPGV